jgi:hypothetical protein
MRGLRRFKVRGKLAPRYIGPFKILEQKAKWPINWNCPLNSLLYTMCSTCQLKKYLQIPEEQVPLKDLVTSKDLTYQEYPVKLLETSERVT